MEVESGFKDGADEIEDDEEEDEEEEDEDGMKQEGMAVGLVDSATVPGDSMMQGV